jgi:hypothetical protein
MDFLAVDDLEAGGIAERIQGASVGPDAKLCGGGRRNLSNILTNERVGYRFASNHRHRPRILQNISRVRPF